MQRLQVAVHAARERLGQGDGEQGQGRGARDGRRAPNTAAHAVALPTARGFSLHRKTSEFPPASLGGGRESSVYESESSRPPLPSSPSSNDSDASPSTSASHPLLFEHFLVVGASEEAAAARAGELLGRRHGPGLGPMSVAQRLKQQWMFGGKQKEEDPVLRLKALASPSRHALDRTADGASVDPAILFRYPHFADPPPNEITDFCLPVRGRLDYIQPAEEETLAREIFYGQGHGSRSSRCFIFMLEDKTLRDQGDDSGRLYGVCLIHPRLLRVPVDEQAGGWGLGFSGRKGSNRGLLEEEERASFASSVCYAFITKFPLFEFFFGVLGDLITLEKLSRMERVHSGDGEEGEGLGSYVPKELLAGVLDRLTAVRPPALGEQLTFSLSNSAIQPLSMTRTRPPADTPEHIANATDWALPILLSWLPVDCLVSLLSLLLCEVKLVVLGNEAGMVSCVVMSLLALLRPLSWVAPLIPVLPLKYLDFVESPVPLLTGVVADGEEGLSPAAILAKCE